MNTNIDPETPRADGSTATTDPGVTTGYAKQLNDRITSGVADIGIIGLGYVGLPLAVTAALRGFPVTGFDIDPSKIEKISEASSYVDAVSNEDLRTVVDSGAFLATTEFEKLSACDVIVICVPTPLSPQREPDLRFVRATAKTISEHATPGTLVVLESTTFPGTTDEVLTPILASGGLVPGTELFVGFSPEREDPGNKSYRTATIPKVVSGDGEAALRLTAAFYGGVVDSVVEVGSTRTAEAVKITENVFRAVNIALVNELKVIFSEMGVDVWDVIDAAATKPFGYMPFYPGPGLGGHCIPIDPFYLTWKAREYGVPTRFIELAGEINTRMPSLVVERLRRVVDLTSGKGLSASRLLIVGMSYKKNVPDMRESPSMKLMELLTAAGAEVAFLDPLVSRIPLMRDYAAFEGREGIAASAVATSGFDAILISTDHDAIDYAGLVATGTPIVDTRNAIERRGLAMTHVHKA